MKAQQMQLGLGVHRLKAWKTSAIVAIFLLGTILRLRGLLSGQALSTDEVFLLTNIRGKNFFECLGILGDGSQAAPPVYLASVKFLSGLLGDSELILWVPSFVAGIGCLLIAASTGRWFQSAWGPLALLMMLAVNSMATEYSYMLKQYQFDLFASFLTLHLSVGILIHDADSQDARVRSLWCWGLVAVWLSHPIVFVLFGVGIAAIFRLRDRRKIILAMTLSWAISFLLHYILILRHTANNDFLLTFWNHEFLPRDTSAFRWMFSHVLDIFFRLPLGSGVFGGVAFLCFVVGFVHLCVAQRIWLAALTLPLITCFCASALQKYPFYGRFLIFSLPSIMAIIVYGAEVLSRDHKRYLANSIALITMALVIFIPAGQSLKELFYGPMLRTRMAEIIKHIELHATPQDKIVTFDSGTAVLNEYIHRVSPPPLVHKLESPQDLQQLDRTECIWVVVSDGFGLRESPKPIMTEIEQALANLDATSISFSSTSSVISDLYMIPATTGL